MVYYYEIRHFSIDVHQFYRYNLDANLEEIVDLANPSRS